MKKIIGSALILGGMVLGFTYADTNTYDMSICNVITNEVTFTGKALVGLKLMGMGTTQGVSIDKAFDTDASTCIYNDMSGANISLYLVDQSYLDQIGGVNMGTGRNITTDGVITDNRFLKVSGTLGSTQEAEFGDGVEKITSYYTVVSTDAGYELRFQNTELNDGAGVVERDSDMWLENSIEWLYDIGATQYDTPEEFGANRSITREEAAKFFSEVKQQRGVNPVQGGNYTCTFRDMASADQTLRASIDLACELGVMKGGQGLFTPKAQLTREQALVVAMRMYTGKMLDEQIRPWYKNYRDVATHAGVFLDGELDSTVDTRMASRGWVALLLYKAHLSAHK